MEKKVITPHVFFYGFLILNILFWGYAHKIQLKWANVPPVPKEHSAALLSLGDEQLAYRTYAAMLQNIGSVGGRSVSLKDYNYQTLKEWFFLEDSFDKKSNVVPMLASNYFGAVDDNEKLDNILDYLAVVGSRPDGEKWRWLGQAVFLARHIQKDNKRALELAYILADNKSPDLADWAKQMPAFILHDEGDSELAYKIMLNILISNIDTLDPNEINFMKDYICNKLIPELKNVAIPSFCEEEGIKS